MVLVSSPAATDSQEHGETCGPFASKQWSRKGFLPGEFIEVKGILAALPLAERIGSRLKFK
jgi:hypothetical protein